jgi:chemotaxis protein methyltransferase CheR
MQVPVGLQEAPAPVGAGDPYIHRIRDLVFDVSGIYHPETKFYYLRDRCARRMHALGLRAMADYHDLLIRGEDREPEMRELLNEITVGETCFFRNQPQLEALVQKVLPPLVAAKSRLGFTRLRVWSAGCSTGEEPYTLAMTLLEESQRLLKGWSFEVVATDINERSLARAREGLYGDYALRNVPLYYRQKFLRPEGQMFRVKDEVRSIVHFGRLNLRDDSRVVFMKGLDVIFCCNVLIYFGAQAKRRVIQHFYSNLLPGGCLFLGHAESLFGLSDEFKLAHFPLAAGYFKPGRSYPGGTP